jgi:hypothetical protein
LKIVENILSKLQKCISSNTYEEIETERIELKNMPPTGADWNSLKSQK